MEDTTPDTDSTAQNEGEVMPAVPAHPNLHSALIAARAAIPARVFKAAHHQGQGGYNYVSHEQVLLHARDALLEHGLLLEERSVSYDGESIVRSQRGESHVWRWTGTFALVHERGEERAYSFTATTQPNDKAAYVASTSLDRLAHMRVLQLAGTSDENAESDWHDQQPGGASHVGQAPRQGPPARQGGPRHGSSNVVDLRDRQGPPTPAPVPEKYRAGLETMQANLAKIREPAALVGWWVNLASTIPELQREPERKRAAWSVFQQHVVSLGLDARAISADIDAALKAAKKGGER
jgi:hypothetical protein